MLATQDIETALVSMWAEILERPPHQIGREDNFFSLGADSLLILRFMDRVNSQFFADRQGAELPLADFFAHGTVRSLAIQIVAEAAGRVAVAPSFVHREECKTGIAIIGMAGRFPGAADLEHFWEMLLDGIEGLRYFSAEELVAAGVSETELADPTYVRCAGLLENVQAFDADYFGIGAGEAALMSPDQRLLIECAHDALEDAGYGRVPEHQRVGVFAGASLSSYLIELLENPRSLETAAGMRLIIGNSGHAGRISFLLNLTGPSMTVDTACSSSLVAIHQAYRSLLSGECGMALAGGATVRRFSPRGYRAEEGGIFSPDGHCRPFDIAAAGTVGSSGAGMVLLKRVEDARADGDSIYAIIRGSAVNNDGNAKVGYTAPGIAGQTDVIAQACAVSGIDPATVQYVETHGTATALGDVIEIAALRQVYGSATRRPLVLGTLKANIGHAEAAAGVASLIKATLALAHARIPPAIHHQQWSPKIELEGSGFYINTSTVAWPAGSGPRRCGVSSFGIGGTNAHVVLEQAVDSTDDASTSKEPPGPQLLTFSARSAAALREMALRLADRLERRPETNLADAAFTLQAGRRVHAFREFIVGHQSAECIQLLRQFSASGKEPARASLGDPAVVFMFPGQGSQRINMMRGLYESEPLFRSELQSCSDMLRPVLGLDILEMIYPTQSSERSSEESGRLLDRTHLCQPALFCVEYALARLWQSWGIQPGVMIGHSLGEYVAACIAGLFTLEDALIVVAARGRLMQGSPPGGMMAVRMGRVEVEAVIPRGCSLAAVNGPQSCVVSGPVNCLETLQRELVLRQIACQTLKTSHAFHSALMDGILDEFRRVLHGVRFHPLEIPFVSNRTGRLYNRGDLLTANHWVDHLRHTVDFAGGAKTILEGSESIFLEVGPGTALASFVRGMAAAQGRNVISSEKRASEPDHGRSSLLNAAGRLWQAGAKLNFCAFNSGRRGRRARLPTYPFERRRLWKDPQHVPRPVPSTPQSEHSTLPDWFYVPVWKHKPVLSAGARPPLECCVLFEMGVAEDLACRLAERYRHVVRVHAADEFSLFGTRATINPARESDFEKLFAQLQELGRSPDLVIDAWQATSPRRTLDSGPEQWMLSGLLGLKRLWRAVEQQDRQRRVTMMVVTNAAFAVTGEEQGDPVAAMLHAAVEVAAKEHSSIDCRGLDVRLSGTDVEIRGALASAVLTELDCVLPERIVAWRGSARYIRDFERITASPRKIGDSLLRHGGTYLITGGMGGVGMTLALHLARTVQARLVLVGRTPFPERARWKELSSRSDAVGEQALRLLEAERGGAEILLASGDVADPERIRAIVAEAVARFGAIHGVIHGAGVAGGGVIALGSEVSTREVCRPKVVGTSVVYEAVREHKPEFFVCCSSIAAVLTPAGQSDYCAANAFQDAFAHAQDAKDGMRVISINWDAWREVGMAVNGPALAKGLFAEGLRSGLSRDEGAAAFDFIMANPRPQWLVSTRELALLRYAPARLLTTKTYSPATLSPQSTPAPAPAEADPVYATVENIWKELLGVVELAPNDSFFDRGGDSLLAVQLGSRLEASFGLSLSLRRVLATATLSEQTNLISSRLSTAVPQPG
jgi:acyl transferase domain-containing protein/acyl carrier protein